MKLATRRILLTSLAVLSLPPALSSAALFLAATENSHWATPPLTRRAITLRLDGRQIFLSWRPATPYRPAWAGQTRRARIAIPPAKGYIPRCHNGRPP